MRNTSKRSYTIVNWHCSKLLLYLLEPRHNVVCIKTKETNARPGIRWMIEAQGGDRRLTNEKTNFPSVIFLTSQMSVWLWHHHWLDHFVMKAFANRLRNFYIDKSDWQLTITIFNVVTFCLYFHCISHCISNDISFYKCTCTTCAETHVKLSEIYELLTHIFSPLITTIKTVKQLAYS